MPKKMTEDGARLKINKETEDLNNTINQPNLTDIYRTLHPTTAAYVFFSSVHRTFSRTNYMLSHKTNLNNVKGLNHTKYVL